MSRGNYRTAQATTIVLEDSGSTLVLHQEPWMLGARADAQGAEFRGALARAVRKAAAGHSDWIMLDTCHRVELYGFGAMPELDPTLRLMAGDMAVVHLLRVAAGLDSAIVGEDEVLHQVRVALETALATRDLDTRLQRLFETAIAAGRRARRGRTAPGENLAVRAIDWLRQKSSLASQSVLVVGAGRMGAALARAASEAGARLTIASRDSNRAHRLAKIYRADSTDLSGAADLAGETSAIAVALAGPWRELEPMPRQLPPLADISAPPAINAEVRARLNGGYLGIDDLYNHPGPVPPGYIDVAERIVEANVLVYLNWLSNRR
ncbi:MAG: NAD(P)-binding domain-containing protein [Candidatus Dormibacteraceae bacterium]